MNTLRNTVRKTFRGRTRKEKAELLRNMLKGISEGPYVEGLRAAAKSNANLATFMGDAGELDVFNGDGNNAAGAPQQPVNVTGNRIRGQLDNVERQQVEMQKVLEKLKETRLGAAPANGPIGPIAPAPAAPVNTTNKKTPTVPFKGRINVINPMYSRSRKGRANRKNRKATRKNRK